MLLPAPCLSVPPLTAWADHAELLAGPAPSIDTLNALRERKMADDGIDRPVFRAQTPQLLADGLHYEQRIARGVLATREGDPHDLFNALVWLRHPALKWALNRRQCADIDVMGPKQRSRGQYAMTHFDEAGAIVWIADEAALACWNAHDWQGLFRRHRDAWGRRVAVTVFGHALLEHVAQRDLLPMARALAVAVPKEEIESRADAQAVMAHWTNAETAIAEAIRIGRLLTDPQQLRPLPLAGLPGWHPAGDDPDFFALPCFRPLREDRRYPQPMPLADPATFAGTDDRYRR